MHQDFAPTSVDPDQQPAGRAGVRGGSWLARCWRRLGWAGRDAQSGLLDRRGLIERGERLLATPRWRRDEAALALLDFRDLLEVRDIYGEHVSAAVQARLADALARMAGRCGLAGRTGPAQFAVLLPGQDRQAAIDVLHRALGKPCRLEHDLPDDELVLVPEVVVDVCEPGELAMLYERLSVTLARHHSWEERRRVHMRRLREHHSRPMPLDAALGAG